MDNFDSCQKLLHFEMVIVKQFFLLPPLQNTRTSTSLSPPKAQATFDATPCSAVTWALKRRLITDSTYHHKATKRANFWKMSVQSPTIRFFCKAMLGAVVTPMIPLPPQHQMPQQPWLTVCTTVLTRELVWIRVGLRLVASIQSGIIYQAGF